MSHKGQSGGGVWSRWPRAKWITSSRRQASCQLLLPTSCTWTVPKPSSRSLTRIFDRNAALFEIHRRFGPDALQLCATWGFYNERFCQQVSARTIIIAGLEKPRNWVRRHTCGFFRCLFIFFGFALFVFLRPIQGPLWGRRSFWSGGSAAVGGKRFRGKVAHQVVFTAGNWDTGGFRKFWG